MQVPVVSKYVADFENICAERFAAMFDQEGGQLERLEDTESSLEALADLSNQIVFMAIKLMFFKDMISERTRQAAGETGFVPTSQAWNPDGQNSEQDK